MKIRIDQSSKKYYLLLALFIVLSLTLTLITPDRSEVLSRYGISSAQLNLVQLGILVPLYFIWAIACYGFVKTRQYAKQIKQDPDGRGFDLLAKGLGLLTLSLPIASLFSAVLSYLSANNLGVIPVGVSISQYTAVSFSLAAYYFLAKGSRQLAKQADPKLMSPGYKWAAIYGAGAGIYSNLLVSRSIKRVAPTATSRATYYLPDWAIALTLILPYVIAWYMGLLSVFYLSHYRREVKGEIYQKALNRLGRGVTMLVIASILVQSLAIFGTKLKDLNLAPLLGIIYVLLIIIAVSYATIASGAKLLRKIEEV